MAIPTNSGGKSEPRQKLTQAQRTARSEELLLRAAFQVIAEVGFERATVATIGEAAGFSRGLITQRFGSKEGLLSALVSRVIQQWETDILFPAIGPRVGIAAVCEFLDALERQAIHGTEDLRALNFLLLDPNPKLRSAFAELNTNLRALIQTLLDKGIDAGHVRIDIDTDAQAALFVSSVRGALYQWVLDPDGIDLSAIFDVMKAQLRTCCAPPERSGAEGIAE